MATTNFSDGVTLTEAGWFDDVDCVGYSVLSGVAGTNTITATGPATYSYAATRPPVWFIPAATNTGATTINVTPSGGSALGARNIFSGGVSLRGGELVVGVPACLIDDGTRFHIIASASTPPMVDPQVFDGRLTLTAGVPVTSTDVTAAETIFLTTYKGNKIALYTGATWKLYTFTELSGDVPDATQMNDVFVYDNAGTLTLDIVAWSTDTARATALALQDGVLVKTGATGRRYVGSFYSTTAGNGQTEDSLAKRYVWNYYNRVRRAMKVVEATNSWSYSTASFQQANASAANQLDIVTGVSEDAVEVTVCGASTNSGATVRNTGVGIGVDSTTVNSAQEFDTMQVSSAFLLCGKAFYRGFPGIGRHLLVWLEQGAGADTQTWIGDNGGVYVQTGIHGSVMA